MSGQQSRPFGPSAHPLGIIGQGTWNLERASQRAAVATLRRGLDLGLTHLDTAEMYGSGEAETLVGEAIAGRRGEAWVVSKVLPQNASRRGVVTACERSLKALRTDYLDVYLLHWRGSVPLAETVEAFVDLQRAGKIRHWGVSNFDVDDLDELERLGLGLPVCNQVLYHLRERAIEHAILPWCQQRGVALTAYTPFGPAPFREHATLTAAARLHDATPRQVALAFLTRHSQVFAIPKASSVAHVEENAGAGTLELGSEAIDLLETAFPRKPWPGHLPMI
ncbi:MAG: aldo/keto reductase [Steroidobacteraceae bacterium]